MCTEEQEICAFRSRAIKPRKLSILFFFFQIVFVSKADKIYRFLIRSGILFENTPFHLIVYKMYTDAEYFGEDVNKFAWHFCFTIISFFLRVGVSR